MQLQRPEPAMFLRQEKVLRICERQHDDRILPAGRMRQFHNHACHLTRLFTSSKKLRSTFNCVSGLPEFGSSGGATMISFFPSGATLYAPAPPRSASATAGQARGLPAT